MLVSTVLTDIPAETRKWINFSSSGFNQFILTWVAGMTGGFRNSCRAFLKAMKFGGTSYLVLSSVERTVSISPKSWISFGTVLGPSPGILGQKSQPKRMLRSINLSWLRRSSEKKYCSKNLSTIGLGPSAETKMQKVKKWERWKFWNGRPKVVRVWVFYVWSSSPFPA